MGSVLQREQTRKRERSNSNSDNSADHDSSSDSTQTCTEGGDDAQVVRREQRLLQRARYRDGAHAGQPLCRCVLDDAVAVMETYGAHYHLYTTATPADAHGVALAWSLSRAPLTLYALLSLCRVANSCRKATVLLAHANNTPEGDNEGDGGDAVLVLLRYTTEL